MTPNKLAERYIRIADVPARFGITIEGVRQAVADDYFPVWIDARGMAATPLLSDLDPDRPRRNRRVALPNDQGYRIIDDADQKELWRGRPYVLPGFMRVLNCRTTESVDGGLIQAVELANTDTPQSIAVLTVDETDNYWLPHRHVVLVKSISARFSELFVFVADLHADGAPRAKDPDAVRDGERSGKSRKELADDKRVLVRQLAEEIRAEELHFKDREDFAKAIRQRAKAFKPSYDASVSLAEGATRTIKDELRRAQIDTP